MNKLCILIVLVLSAATVHAHSTLDFTRVHYVDHFQLSTTLTNFLFRSNEPINTTTLDYDALTNDLRLRAQEEANLTLPETFYLLDLSLDNIFDGSDNTVEQGFWADAAHTKLGGYVNWPIGFAGILPPSLYTQQEIMDMTNPTNGSVWKTDEIPQRLEVLRSMLINQHASGLPLVIVVHCEAGCDRTGQMIGSYRMRYQNKNVTEMYALDTKECGRSPNYYGSTGLEWYCYTLQLHQNINPGNCTGFATCTAFGSCQPTVNTTIVAL